MIQPDDHSRNALVEFFRCRDENAFNMVAFCKEHAQYWKGRVFLELLWDYEDQQRQIRDLKELEDIEIALARTKLDRLLFLEEEYTRLKEIEWMYQELCK
jgi:cell shape-determining protein MreC